MRTLGWVGHHPTSLFLLVTGRRLRLAQSRLAAPRRVRVSQADPNQLDQPAGRQPKFSRRPGKRKSFGSSQERRTASRIQLWGRGGEDQDSIMVSQKTSLECLQEMAATVNTYPTLAKHGTLIPVRNNPYRCNKNLIWAGAITEEDLRGSVPCQGFLPRGNT